MPLLYPMGFLKAAGGGPASIAFAASAVDTSNSTSYTFSGHNIGTASADRYVVIAVTVKAKDATSVTVDGASTTAVVTQYSSTTCFSGIYITDAPVTSGTTASIVVTTNAGGGTCCGIGTFALTGLVSTTAGATATQTADNTSTNLAVVANGVALCAGSANGGPSFSFTTANLTERYDATVEGGNMGHTGACDNQASTQTLGITIDCSTGTVFANVYAAFR